MIEFSNGDLRKFVFEVVKFEGRWYINLRQWGRYNPRSEKDWRPTKKGISIPLILADDFKKAIRETLIELDKIQKREVKKDDRKKTKRAGRHEANRLKAQGRSQAHFER